MVGFKDAAGEIVTFAVGYSINCVNFTGLRIDSTEERPFEGYAVVTGYAAR